MSNNISVPQGDGMKLKINRFDLKFCRNPSIVIVAKRGSGKSWVARHIIRCLIDIPIVIVISPTEEHDPFYSKFIPETFIFYKYETEILDRIIIRQRKAIEKATLKYKEGHKADPRILIVMDDCFGENKKWIKDPCITEIMNNGRHLQISYILVMQYVMDVTPNIRSNFDYVFLLADDSYQNLDKLYKQYAGIFPTAESFRTCFKTLTSNYGCMVLIKREARNDFGSKVKFFRAKEVRNMPISRQMLTFYNNRFNSRWKNTNTSNVIDIEDFANQSKKEKRKINIEIN